MKTFIKALSVVFTMCLIFEIMAFGYQASTAELTSTPESFPIIEEDFGSTPLLLSGNESVTQVSAGANYTAILKSDGTVWTWGQNDEGECGTGTASATSTIAQVTGLTDVTYISAGCYTCYAVKSDGTVWAWGSKRPWAARERECCQLQRDAGPGVNADRRTAGFGGIYFALALKSDGAVWSWEAIHTVSWVTGRRPIRIRLFK